MRDSVKPFSDILPETGLLQLQALPEAENHHLFIADLFRHLYGGFITKPVQNGGSLPPGPETVRLKILLKPLLSARKRKNTPEDLALNKQILYTILRRSSFGLVNAVRQIKLAPGENILLILDQFEELFRFKESRKDITVFNETEAYIKMLVNAIKAKRSAYLCGAYHAVGFYWRMFTIPGTYTAYQ